MSNSATNLTLNFLRRTKKSSNERSKGLQGFQIRQIVVATSLLTWCGILLLFQRA